MKMQGLFSDTASVSTLGGFQKKIFFQGTSTVERSSDEHSCQCRLWIIKTNFDNQICNAVIERAALS